MKKAVLLINLGSPDKPTIPSVWKYLRQFLMDARVIDVPWILRFLLVNFIIIPFRVKNSTKEYKKMWKMHGKSPLIKNTDSLTKKLKLKYSDKYDFYFAMRYQNPSIDDALEKIYAKNYDELIILPLYPQYASASSGSTIEYCNKIINKWWNFPKITIISNFFNDQSYINCIVENAKKFEIENYDHILFSYHGLPERHVDKTYVNKTLCADNECEKEITDDNKFCYKAMCYETTKLIAKELVLSEEQYSVTFQSRLDDKWLKPYTDNEIIKLAQSGKSKVLIFSPAFVSDCLETIVEINEANKEDFIKKGGEKFDLVPSLNDNDKWVDSIITIIENNE